METVQFLGEIDDEELYTKKLELVYGCAYEEVLEILSHMPTNPPDSELWDHQLGGGKLRHSVTATQAQLQKMSVVMALQIRQMAERKARLADIAVGLTDRVLDEQST